jgi:hypothetical protein
MGQILGSRQAGSVYSILFSQLLSTPLFLPMHREVVPGRKCSPARPGTRTPLPIAPDPCPEEKIKDLLSPGEDK